MLNTEPSLAKLKNLAEEEINLVICLALFNHALSVNLVCEIFKLRAQLQMGALAPQTKKISDDFQKLAKESIVQQEIGKGYALRGEYRMAAFMLMQESVVFDYWIIVIREYLKRTGAYQYWNEPDSNFFKREILFSILQGHTEDALLWREKYFGSLENDDPLPWMEFFNSELGQQVCAKFKPVDQAWLLKDVFSLANWDLSECTAAYVYACDSLQTQDEHWPQLVSLVGMQALLRGDVERFNSLRLLIPENQRYEIDLVHAVQQGRIADAVAFLPAFKEAWKAVAGKRKLFIPATLGLFCTVACLVQKDEASLKFAKAQVDGGVKQREAFSYRVVQPFVQHLLNGTPLEPAPLPMQGLSMDLFFQLLFADWMDGDLGAIWERLLPDMREKARACGYHWVAAELEQLLHRRYAKPLTMEGWHAEHDSQPLAALWKKEKAWERALHALAQFKSNAVAASVKNENSARMIWMLGRHYEQWSIEPREQKFTRTGGWTKGRAVALRRLMLEQDKLTFLTQQDQRIAACIRRSNNYYGSEYEFDMPSALLKLINHPAVFWADASETRIDIAAGEVALQLKNKDQQISLQLEPYFDKDFPVVWQQETPTKIVVYAATPEIKQIAAILGRGLTVPASAKAQLVDVVAAIAPHLPIHSDLPELAQHMASIAADARLYLHLLPLHEGLRAQLLVRPLSEGAWHTPGRGAAQVLGEVEGKAVQAVRELVKEKQRMQDLLGACPALQDNQQGESTEWQFDAPEQCLELLSQLHALPAETLELVWPEGERFRLRGSYSMKNLSLTIKRQGDWFGADGSLTLDDGRVFALREILQMNSQAQGRFIKIGEQEFFALSAAFQQRLQELQRLAEISGKTGLQIHAASAPFLADLAAEVGEVKSDTAWRAQVKKLDGLTSYTPALPSTLQAELRDYQLSGYQWLARLAEWGVGACLADDMGLGKTVQTLALLLQRAPQGPALVVAPTSVVMNWQSEALRFAPSLRVRLYNQERNLTELGAFDLVFASYGMLQSDAASFAEQHWHSIVLDEAQAIKNAATKRSQAAMALQADFKMVATGTPVENHLGELWNLFRFINPGLLGSKERFAERFSNPIERGDKLARQHLKKLLQPFILRRTKTQVLSELPPRTEITLQVELSEAERHWYEAMRQEALEQLTQAPEQENQSLKVLAQITRLRRFCCNPQLVLKNTELEASKLAVFADTLEEILDNRHKVLVFSQFVDHLAIIRTHLEAQNIRYQYLDGATPLAERKKRVDAFQAGEGDVFLISLKAGGTGLNLTAADYVIHLDPWWNPAVEDQASDRAHRMGQQRPVTIYRLVTQNTIEEKILALHAQKRDLADTLLAEGDAAARLDTAALLRLLREEV